jgi:hypothetical protein
MFIGEGLTRETETGREEAAMQLTFKICLCLFCSSADVDMDACVASQYVSPDTGFIAHL